MLRPGGRENCPLVPAGLLGQHPEGDPPPSATFDRRLGEGGKCIRVQCHHHQEERDLAHRGGRRDEEDPQGAGIQGDRGGHERVHEEWRRLPVSRPATLVE